MKAKTLNSIWSEDSVFATPLKELHKGMDKQANTKDKRKKLNKQWKRYTSRKQREVRKLWIEENVKQPLILSKLDLPIVLRRH